MYSTAAIRVTGSPQPFSVQELPAQLPDDPGHDLWRRDFTGASSLFGVVLETGDEAAVSRMVDGYRYFKIGASWGGYESLVLPASPKHTRTAVPWNAPGYVLRYHVGLEDPDDLIADLADGFDRLADGD